jgi:hypothetical protein
LVGSSPERPILPSRHGATVGEPPTRGMTRSALN